MWVVRQTRWRAAGGRVAGMTEMGVDRRGLLRRVGLAAGAVAVVPLLGGVGSRAVAAGAADPDALFQAGELAAAERGYRARWAPDPLDAHVASQLGDLALLSDRCDEAERWLRTALRLAPGDGPSRRLLATCYLRRDRLAEARPLLPPPDAAQAAAVTGTPYAMGGAASTRVPWLDVDPLPHLTASVNGASGTFVLDTGAAQVTLSSAAAERAGLEAVASSSGAVVNGRPVTTYLGVAASVRIGAVELRNVPVTWLDGDALALPGGLRPDGTIGTPVFYRFLTTFDYRHRALVLRPKTTVSQHGHQMWLADHLPCAEATLNTYGPRVAAMDTGGLGVGLNTTAANARKAGIDTTQPVITAGRVGLAGAVHRHVPATVGPAAWEGLTRFGTIGNVTHEFYKPFAVTFDFARMRLSVG